MKSPLTYSKIFTNKQLIKIENLATHFNKSADHLSRYFKNTNGQHD